METNSTLANVQKMDTSEWLEWPVENYEKQNMCEHHKE